jgi:hypothetical protein
MWFLFREPQKMLNFKSMPTLRNKVKHTLFVFLIIGASCVLQAQDPVRTGPGLGFHVHQIKDDFGIGISATSPLFLKNILGIRARVNLAWHEHASLYNTYWTPYPQASIGVVGIGGMAGPRIRLYGEGGFIALFPADDFSSTSFYPGGYGHFGFEFFMNPVVNYFIELGGVGTGAIADAQPQRPVFANGFSAIVGFRYYFKPLRFPRFKPDPAP